MTKQNPTWVRWYASDALAGTVTLTPAEELAYRRILDMIFASDDRLRDDDRIMPTATKAGRQWRAVKCRLIELGKISIEGGFIRNHRASESCDDARGYRAQKRAAAIASHADGKRLNNQENKPAGAEPPQPPRSDPADAEGLPANSQQLTEKNLEEATLPLVRLPAAPANRPRAKANREQEPEGFAEWYQAYPRHEGRAAAAKAFPAACRKVGGPARLMDLLRSHRFTSDPRFIPHPASWLNGERWKDAPRPADDPQRRSNGPAPKYAWFRGGSTPAADDDFYPSEKPILDLASGDWR